MGVRHALFPALAIRRAPFCGGCQLPDAILHGKRSHRPRSRAVQRLTSAEFRVRLFSLLELMVAPPACKPGLDTSANSFPRLYLLAPGQLPILSERSPGATGLASSLSDCISFSGRRWCFSHRRHFGRFSRIVPGPRVLPCSNAHFVLPFGFFRLADPALLFAEPPESFARADAQ